MAREASRAAVLAARPARSEVVRGPGGVEVRVTAMSAGARAELVEMQAGVQGDRHKMLTEIHPALVVATARDVETGELLFTAADREQLMELEPTFLDELAFAALRVSGMDKGAEEEAGKGSAPTLSGASNSALPSPLAAQSES